MHYAGIYFNDSKGAVCILDTDTADILSAVPFIYPALRPAEAGDVVHLALAQATEKAGGVDMVLIETCAVAGERSANKQDDAQGMLAHYAAGLINRAPHPQIHLSTAGERRLILRSAEVPLSGPDGAANALEMARRVALAGVISYRAAEAEAGRPADDAQAAEALEVV